MCKQINKKLLEQKGETLLETLVSLLIAVLAMGFVSTATIAAANMNKANQEMDDKYAADLYAAETYTAEGVLVENGLKIIFEEGSNIIPFEDDIIIYGNEEGVFASYTSKLEGEEQWP